jgi:hypothetical protein
MGAIQSRDRGGSFFAALARAAGIKQSFAFDQVGKLEAELPKLLALPGPVFGALQVVQGEPKPTDYDWVNAIDRIHELKAALAPARGRG